MDEGENPASLKHIGASHPFIQSWKEKIQQKLNSLNVTQKKEDKVNLVLKLIQENRRREKFKEKEKKEKKEREFWAKHFPRDFPSPKEKVKPESFAPDFPASQLFERSERIQSFAAQENNDNESEVDSDEEIFDIEDIFPSTEKRETDISKEVHHQTVLPPLKDVEIAKKTFICRPNKLVFKDFEIGNTYKRKIILFNASGVSNTCRIEGITNELEGLLKFKLTKSSNNIAPDMHCILRVYFTPTEEKNIDGEICLICKTGLFRIPVEIQKKVSKIKISSKIVDFGQQHIGTASIKLFSIINEGAKKIQFNIFRYRGFPTASYSYPQVASIPQDFSQKSFEVASSGTEFDTELNKGDTEISETEEYESIEPSSGLAEVSNTSKSRSDTAMAGLDDFQLMMSDHDVEILDGFSFGQMSGIIDGHSKVEVEITFNPVIPGSVEAYFVVNLDDLDNEEFLIQVSGIGMDPPVSVEKENYDMKICVYDHVYQDVIIVKNSSSKISNINFEISKQMKNYLEIIPSACLIQPMSSFSVCLKFHPRISLEKIGENFYDVQTGVLEAPIHIRTSDQRTVATVILSAVVTSADLLVSPEEIDFGITHINETVKTTIQITNPAFINQKFGFVDLPTFLTIQPQDGFGIILPQETLSLELMFSPKVIQKYKFSLTCKTLLNRVFHVKCRGIGVELPVHLSHNLVKFPPTTLHSCSVTNIHLEHNCHEMKKDLTPSIKFRFVVPFDFPGSIEPYYGILENNKAVKIFLTFSPCYEETNGKQDKVSASNEQDNESISKYDIRPSPDTRNQSPDRQVSTISGSKDSYSLTKRNNLGKQETMQSLSVDINSGSTEYCGNAAEVSDIAKLQTFSIPCFFMMSSFTDEMKWQPSNHCLNLDVICPTAKSSLALSGPSFLNFGVVAVGQKVTKEFTIKNISKKKFQISTSYLNGPFLILNSLQEILPDKLCTLKISYEPKSENKDLEILDIYYDDENFISITLSGESVLPKFSFNPTIANLNLGYALTGDFSEFSFSIENKSKINLSFFCVFDNNEISFLTDPTSHLPKILQRDGCWNLNGTNVFADETSKKSLDEETVMHLKFKSTLEGTYKCKCKLFLMNNREFPIELVVLEAFGTASNSSVCLANVDIPGNKITLYEFVIQKGIENLNQDDHKKPAKITSQPSFTEKGKKKMEPGIMSIPLETKHCYLHLYTSWTDSGAVEVSRSVSVAYILGHSGSSRKTLDFVIELAADTDRMGFSWEPAKGSIDIGSSKEIIFKWSPQSFLRMSQLVFTSVCIRCKAEVSKDFVITLCGGIITPEKYANEIK